MDYINIISKCVADIKPSGIRKFFDLAANMDDVISLGVGEPDFKTPYAIRQAGIASLQKGMTWYTANSGLAELRSEISKYLSRRFNLSYNPQGEILVTVGGSEGIDLCMRTVINPGDEVLIPEPCFVAYNPIARLAGGVPIPIETKAQDSFKLTPQALKAAITDKTKLLVLPYPANPTGAIMDRQALEQIAEVLRDTNILVLSDEIYAELTYEGKHISIASIDGMWERTIIINGFSKAFAMTGWRLGYACAPAPILSQMTKVHQFALMSAPTTAQYAAIEAMRSCDDEITKMAVQFGMRRGLLVSELTRMGLKCANPLGAFYVFPDITSTGLTSEQFAEGLLNSQRVAVVPGNAFGECGEGFVRISYSYSVEHLIEALARIKKYLIEISALPSDYED